MKPRKGKAPVTKDEASSAAEDDEHPDDAPEEEDDFLVSDGEEAEAAAKNAAMAASRVVDVDIDGGWKQGESYALHSSHLISSSAHPPRIEYRTKRSPTYSPKWRQRLND